MATGEELLAFFKWRLDAIDQHQQRDDQQLLESFASRAQEIADSVRFVLQSGLSGGAEESLGAMAEQDMGDFCIMVDLAQGVPLPGVSALDKDTSEHLREFLDHEPWHSLLVDNDITVGIAMLEDVASRADEGPWYQVCPNMARVVAAVLDQANAEQLQRFAGEIEALGKRNEVALPRDAAAIIENLVHSNAERLGIKPPGI